MTDSLKERLTDWREQAHFWEGRAKEALARIEELEGEVAYEKRCRDANLKAYHEAQATIAKLEGENKELIEDNKILMGNTNAAIEDYNDSLATIAKLEAENKRLQQESNYWQMAAMHANEREEESQAEIERLREALEGVVRDVLEYERINNLSPNPGRKYCWDSVERAVAALSITGGGK